MSHNRKKRTGFQISTLYIFVYFIHANIFDDLFIHLRQIHVSVAVCWHIGHLFFGTLDTYCICWRIYGDQ